MYIEKIEVKGFGKLLNSTIVLKKGINLIFGINEAGKSTLQSFIRAMLYGIRGTGQSRNGFIQPQKMYSPWHGDQFGGTMLYTLDDGSTYRVERDFEKNELLIFDSSYNEISDQFTLGKDKLPMFAEKQLGIDEETFDRTAFISQMNVRISADGSEALAIKLANVSSTGAEEISYSRAEKALTEALKKNIGTERTTTQPINRLEEKLKILQEKRDRLHAQKEQRLLSLQELQMIQSRHVKLDFKMKYLEHIGGLIELRELLDQNLKKEAYLREVLKELREPESILAENSGEGIHAQAQQKEEILRRKRDKGPKKALISVPLIFLTSAVIFLILFIYAVVRFGMDIPMYLTAIFGSGLVVSLGAAILTSGKRSGRKEAVAPKAEPDQDKAVRIAEVAAGDSTAAMLDASLNRVSILYDEKVSSLADLKLLLSETTHKLEDLSVLLDKGISQAYNMEVYYTEAFNKENLETIIYDSELDELKAKLKDETDRVKKGLMDCALKEKYYEGLLEDSQSENDDWQKVVEEISSTKEKIAQLRYKGNALKLAHEVLMEAGAEIKRNFAPGLNCRMSEIIDGLTGGRYVDLRGDDKLALMISVPEGGDVKSVQTLSGAAADQMYLALRLSMLDIIQGEGESLPVMMDEVFSQFDDKRTALAIKYIFEEYQKKQVLIFTCKQREVEIAREICGSSLNFVEL